jgi:hypothetical protein
MAPEAPREQEQSIKARKHEIFDGKQKVSTGPRKGFTEYLHDTPPAPLAPNLKSALWILLAVALLLFLAAIFTIPGPRNSSSSTGSAPATAPKAETQHPTGR